MEWAGWSEKRLLRNPVLAPLPVLLRRLRMPFSRVRKDFFNCLPKWIAWGFIQRQLDDPVKQNSRSMIGFENKVRVSATACTTGSARAAP